MMDGNFAIGLFVANLSDAVYNCRRTLYRIELMDHYIVYMENPGFDPGASSLLTTHSTN